MSDAIDEVSYKPMSLRSGSTVFSTLQLTEDVIFLEFRPQFRYNTQKIQTLINYVQVSKLDPETSADKRRITSLTTVLVL
jgi:hypothetical protein